MLIQADEAVRIAEAVMAVIEHPQAREAIRRITKCGMRLSTRQHSQGKDALWELTLPGRPTPYAIACKKLDSDAFVGKQFSKRLKQLAAYSGAVPVAFKLDVIP